MGVSTSVFAYLSFLPYRPSKIVVTYIVPSLDTFSVPNRAAVLGLFLSRSFSFLIPLISFRFGENIPLTVMGTLGHMTCAALYQLRCEQLAIDTLDNYFQPQQIHPLGSHTTTNVASFLTRF